MSSCSPASSLGRDQSLMGLKLPKWRRRRMTFDNVLRQVERYRAGRIGGQQKTRQESLSQVRVGVAVFSSLGRARHNHQREDLLCGEAQFLEDRFQESRPLSFIRAT